MKNIYCIVCDEYRKYRNPKISYIFEKIKALVLSVICSKCDNKDKKMFKEEELNEISKMLDSVNNIEYQNKYDW